MDGFERRASAATRKEVAAESRGKADALNVGHLALEIFGTGVDANNIPLVQLLAERLGLEAPADPATLSEVREKLGEALAVIGATIKHHVSVAEISERTAAQLLTDRVPD